MAADETSTSVTTEKFAPPAAQNGLALPTEGTMYANSSVNNQNPSEDTSKSSGVSSTSEQPMENAGSEKADSSSVGMPKDQPEMDSKSMTALGGHERKHTLGEDPAAMTIDFLRARLLSERAISKSARQQTELLARKVMELERILEAEVEKRRLSQLAAEQALTKLQNAGVPLDSTQLDIFVREFDSRKDGPTYQHRESSAGSESLVTSSLKSQRVNKVRIKEDLACNQSKDFVRDKSIQSPEEPLSNATNPESDGDKTGASDTEELAETEGVNLQTLSPASESLRQIPVRGVGRSCRTFKKRHTSEPMLESWNDLSEDAVESQNKEEQESTELSGWVNHVVDRLDGNSRKNSISSSESEWTDIGQSDAADLDCEKEQQASKKNTNQVHSCEAAGVQLHDPNSADISAEKTKIISGEKTREGEVDEEVKKLLDHRAEFIALNQSEENVQMLWEQQHSSRKTSKQSLELESDTAVGNSHLQNLVLQEQEGRFEPGSNTSQLQEQKMKSEPEGFTSSFQTQNPNDGELPGPNLEKQATERTVDMSLESAKNVKDLQCIEQDKPWIKPEQFQASDSEMENKTCLLVHREDAPLDLLHTPKRSHEVSAKILVDSVNSLSEMPPDSSVLLANDIKVLGSQSKNQSSTCENECLGSCVQQSPFEFAAVVKDCSGDTTGEGEKEMTSLEQSASLSQATLKRNGHSQLEYGSDSNDSNNHGNGVDPENAAKKDMSTGNWTGENSWAAVPLKADLQRQVSNSISIAESSQNSSTTSPTLRNSKRMEFPQRFAGLTEMNEKEFWKPSNSDNLYKDVLNRSQSLEYAAGTFRGRPTRTYLHQDQVFLQHPSHYDAFLADTRSRMPYEASIKHQHESDFHTLMKDIHSNPYSLQFSKPQNFQPFIPESSRIEPFLHSSDERAHKVLLALRHAKEQLRESIEQRQRLSQINAQTEDFQRMSVADLPPTDIHYPLAGHSLMRQSNELQQTGISRDFGIPSFYNVENGLPNYVPLFNPDVSKDYRQLPLITGTELVPRNSPLSLEPMSSYVDKLNVGKGIEFFFRR